MTSRFAIPAFLLALAVPAPAAAVFVAAEPADGPSSDVRLVTDVDIARDGSGAVGYVRRDGGVDHAFVTRIVSGIPQPVERVDPGLAAATSQMAIAASDGGRVVAVYASGGAIFAAVRPSGAPAFTTPQLISAAGSDPSVDMSINGVAYATFTMNGDVRAARLERNATTFTLLDFALDVDQPRTAGEGSNRSRVAIAADGTALVTWGEGHPDGRTHVYGRRLFEMRVSTAPQDLTLPDLEGRPGRSATAPEVDIEDDSSFAWVTFRQEFADGVRTTTRAIARRLVGSLFEPPAVVDGISFGSPDTVASARVDLNGRGEGLFSVASALGTWGAILKDDKLNPAGGVAAGGADAQPAGGVAENLDRVIGWYQNGTVLGRHYDDRAESRVPPEPGPPETVSRGDLGAVDPRGGLDVAVNRAGDATFAFIQDDGTGGRRLMVGGYDRPPATFNAQTATRWRNKARPTLAWAVALDLWGPLTYRAEVDGAVVGQTQDTRLVPLNRLPEGEHRWRVIAADRRGQEIASPPRLLRVDTVKPKLGVSIRRRGSSARVTARAADVIPPGARASGVRHVRIDFGDRSRVVTARRWTHRYGRKGRFTIRVSATDRAGNATVVRRRVRVK